MEHFLVPARHQIALETVVSARHSLACTGPRRAAHKINAPRYYESRTVRHMGLPHWLLLAAIHPEICTFGRRGLDEGLETGQTLVL